MPRELHYKSEDLFKTKGLFIPVEYIFWVCWLNGSWVWDPPGALGIILQTNLRCFVKMVVYQPAKIVWFPSCSSKLCCNSVNFGFLFPRAKYLLECEISIYFVTQILFPLNRGEGSTTLQYIRIHYTTLHDITLHYITMLNYVTTLDYTTKCWRWKLS